MDWGSFLCGFGFGVGSGVVAGFLIGAWAQRKVPVRLMPSRNLMEALTATQKTAPMAISGEEGWGTMPQGRPPPPRTENPMGPRPPTPQEARSGRDRRTASEGARLVSQLEAADIRGEL